jgi:hypothetical protein
MSPVPGNHVLVRQMSGDEISKIREVPGVFLNLNLNLNPAILKVRIA